MKKSINSNIILILILILPIFLLDSCGNSSDPTNSEPALKYISQNNSAVFKQEAWGLLTEGAKIPIPDSTFNLKREKPTVSNNLYTYTYKKESDESIVTKVENLSVESDKIFTEFKKTFSLATQNVEIDLKKIPLLDLSISNGEKTYVDTLIKTDIDIKDLINSPMPILINIDIKITSKLAQNSNSELVIGGKHFNSKSFTNTVNFTITTNDFKLNMLYPEYNNKMFVSGSLKIESWFSETENLGLIYQSETTEVKDELFTKQTIINTLISRTMQSYK